MLGGICDGGDYYHEQIVEIVAKDHWLVQILCSTSRVGALIEMLAGIGCGSEWGLITVSTIDAMTPNFYVIRKVLKGFEEETEIQDTFDDFKSDRLTTEEIYNAIFDGASIGINTAILLIAAIVIAFVGLASNSSVAVVASMLISPLMNPLLAVTLGIMVNDTKLLFKGLRNECVMVLAAFFIGAFLGPIFRLILSEKSYPWPNAEMDNRGTPESLYLGVLVATVSGFVVGVCATQGGINSLVGVAISASLLPPVVNSGLLYSTSIFFPNLDSSGEMYIKASYSIGLYLLNVVLIITCSCIVFYFKEISGLKFKKYDDSVWHDSFLMLKNRMKRRKQMIVKGRRHFSLDTLRVRAASDEHAKNKVADVDTVIPVRANSDSHITISLPVIDETKPFSAPETE